MDVRGMLLKMGIGTSLLFPDPTGQTCYYVTRVDSLSWRIHGEEMSLADAVEYINR